MSINKNKLIYFSLIFTLAGCLCCLCVEAGYVTMAQVDLNDDGSEDIVRSEEQGDGTVFRIYERIPSSYFFRPTHHITVSGKLVQVPDIGDFTNDGLPDIYFATGADIGIIYYDTVEQIFKRENEVNETVQQVYTIDSAAKQKEHMRASDESDFLLQLEQEQPAMPAHDAHKPDQASLQTI